MKSYNILLAGVGGQGLVLTTKIICEAAFAAGYDVKSNDVIGLSQRGGKVWGSVKMAKRVYSPNIASGEGDILIALEPLEALRWSKNIKKGGRIIMNNSQIPPVHVIAEKDEYPQDIEERLSEKFMLDSIDASSEAAKLGSAKVANTILLGIVSKYVEIPSGIWEETIRKNVPSNFVEMNIRAFEVGRGM